MLPNNFFQTFSRYFDKERCLERVNDINKSDRWFNFSSFECTARYCFEQMRQAGLEEVEMLPLRADGRTTYGDWVIPQAWDVQKGILRVETPFTEDSILADYESNPFSLFMHSASTPAGGMVAEVVVVDDAEAIKPDAVRGKFILTSRKPNSVADLAVQGKAVGIISDFFPLYPGSRDSREDVYDAVRWENDFMCPINKAGLLGFSISPAAGDRLRALIASAEDKGEKILLKADVQARFYDGVNYTVSGLIPGTDMKEEEVFVYGHLYEPGANDNATGCGAILETAVALKNAIECGALPTPKRSIRFALGFECAGSMGYFEMHSDRIGRTKAAIVMDMVGAADKCRSKYKVWHNTLSNWSYTDTLILAIEREYRKYSGQNYIMEETDFTIATDNMLSDPIYDMPTVSLIMYPSLCYHSSMDDMSFVDPEVLYRSGMIAGCYLYCIASAEADDVKWLLDEIQVDARTRLQDGADDGKSYLLSRGFVNGCLALKQLIPDADAETIRRIEETAMKLPRVKRPDDFINIEQNEVYARGELVPVRLVRGCINLSKLTEDEIKKSKWRPSWNDELNTLLFWTDGHRNIIEITLLTAMEFGHKDTVEYFKEVLEYFIFLQEHGYVKFTTP